MFFFAYNLLKGEFMKKIINFTDDIEFRNNIYEISSISLEREFEATENDISGTFIITGSYRGHEISLNQESFTKKTPFSYHFEEPMDKETITMEVDDFTYEIDQNKLCVEIEYEIEGDKMVFDDEREFDKFLENHEVEIVDFKDDTKEEKEEEKPIIEESVEEEKVEICEPEKEEVKEEKEKNEDREVKVDTEIMDTLTGGENTYITYHIHVCDESDTLEYIANKYKISIDVIKDYNSIDNISVGMKLIIPCQDE